MFDLYKTFSRVSIRTVYAKALERTRKKCMQILRFL